jgi:hypothetical protein
VAEKSMTKASLSREEFELLVLDNHDRQWEVIRGELREKPAMTFAPTGHVNSVIA